MNAVCVFCGSSAGVRPAYRAAAERLGAAVARRGLRLVYGGAQVGLMGAVADAALAAGGEVVGVLPAGLGSKELAHAGLTELHVVQTMHERKAKMADLASAFIALPGGFGTLDELFEALTWTQIGIQAKPCGLLDVEGYFDALRTFLDRAAAEGFVRAEHLALVRHGADADALLDDLAAWSSPPGAPRWRTSVER